MPRYQIDLTEEERDFLEGVIKRGSHKARTVILFRALLLCDKGPLGPGWESDDIVKALGISDRTLERLKKSCVEEGIKTAIERKPQEIPSRSIQFDGAFEARVLALACSEAPMGRERWTIRLLAEKVVELEIAASVSTMTIQRALKK
jgi:hypothetical protein